MYAGTRNYVRGVVLKLRKNKEFSDVIFFTLPMTKKYMLYTDGKVFLCTIKVCIACTFLTVGNIFKNSEKSKW